MKYSFFTTVLARAMFIRDNSSKMALSSDTKRIFREEWKRSGFDKFEDYFYNLLGYKNDSNMAPYARAMKRKEIMENVSNNEYWIKQEEKYGLKRTSEVIELFESLDVLGVERFNSNKNNKYTTGGFFKFYKEHKKTVNSFCKYADTFRVNIMINENYLTWRELKNVLVSKNANELLKKLEDIGDITRITTVDFGKVFIIKNNHLTLPRELQDNSLYDVMKFLLVAYVFDIPLLSQDYRDIAIDLLYKARSLGTMPTSEFLKLVDISNLLGVSINEMSRALGYSFGFNTGMLRKVHGVYSICDVQQGLIQFVPETCTDAVALPCLLTLDQFCMLVNTGKSVNITYRKGIPYLEGTMMNFPGREGLS